MGWRLGRACATPTPMTRRSMGTASTAACRMVAAMAAEPPAEQVGPCINCHSCGRLQHMLPFCKVCRLQSGKVTLTRRHDLQTDVAARAAMRVFWCRGGPAPGAQRPRLGGPGAEDAAGLGAAGRLLPHVRRRSCCKPMLQYSFLTHSGSAASPAQQNGVPLTAKAEAAQAYRNLRNERWSFTSAGSRDFVENVLIVETL
jgi:hypothetical protein